MGDARSKADGFHLPLRVRGELPQKPLHVPAKSRQVMLEFLCRAFAGAHAHDPVCFIQGHKIDLGVGPVPVAADPRGEGEIAYAFATPLLIQNADQLLKGLPLR